MEYIVTFFFFECIQSFDREAFLIRYRIPVRCQNDAHGCVVFEFQIDLIQRSVNTCLKHIDDIGLHSRKNNLCLRITETGIVLKYLRTVCGQHQTEENDSLELSSLCCHRIYRCLIDMCLTECIHFFRIERAWREGSHTTGIQSLISVFGTFVILCGSHRFDGFSVHISQNRYLTTGHELFNYHRIAGIAEFFIFHDLFDTVLCFFQCITDQYTFSQCQSVRFQNDREFCGFQIGKRFLRIGKVFISSCRNVVFFHQIFGKCFGAFQDRCIFSRSEYTQSLCLKGIYHAANQRIVHTDDGQIDRFFFCKSHQFVKFHRTDVDTFCIFFNSRIARCTVDFVNFRTLCYFPCDCMFSSAASYDQYVHVFPPIWILPVRPLPLSYHLQSDQSLSA